MPRVWKFHLPTQVHFGRGSLRRLDTVVRPLADRVLLVGYRDAPALEEVYARAAQSLKKAGVSVAVFRGVDADPPLDVVEAGVGAALAVRAEAIVALGGGSVLDAAKGIAAAAKGDKGDEKGEAALLGPLAPRPLFWDHCEANPEARPIDDALPVVAVPTTAGTGSEVSHVAVFGFSMPGGDDDPVAIDAPLPLKAGIWGDALRPRAAIVDPDLSVGMAPRQTAACALDALGHAIESLVSRQCNPLAATLAVRAAALVLEALPQALAEPEAREPRESLALAALLAGAAFTESGVTVGHAMAHALGAVLEAPHAEAVAATLAAGLRYNAPIAGAALAPLLQSCGGPAGDDASAAAWLVDRVEALRASAGLPAKIVSAGGLPERRMTRLIASALRGTPSAITLNPRKVDAAGLAALFAEIVEA